MVKTSLKYKHVIVGNYCTVFGSQAITDNRKGKTDCKEMLLAICVFEAIYCKSKFNRELTVNL